MLRTCQYAGSAIDRRVARMPGRRRSQPLSESPANRRCTASVQSCRQGGDAGSCRAGVLRGPVSRCRCNAASRRRIERRQTHRNPDFRARLRIQLSACWRRARARLTRRQIAPSSSNAPMLPRSGAGARDGHSPPARSTQGFPIGKLSSRPPMIALVEAVSSSSASPGFNARIEAVVRAPAGKGG